MLGLTRKTRNRTTQTLLALVGSLWLLAAATPCVMAMPQCPPDMAGNCIPTDQPVMAAVVGCDALTAVSCQVSGDERLAPAAAGIDFSVVPVRLHALPVAAALHKTLTPDRYATVILSPPLNLQHAVLLI